MRRDSHLALKVDVAIVAECVLFLVIGHCCHMRYHRPFRSSFVCARCGMLCDSTAWEIPGVRVTIFQRSAVQSTPVSEALRTNSIVGVHRHDWQFVHGSGPSILCALGNAGPVARTVCAEEVANFVNTLQQLGATELRDRIVTNVFNEHTTLAVRFVSQTPLPTSATPMNIDAWLREQSVSLGEWLEGLK
jgi:hypothetical protein